MLTLPVGQADDGPAYAARYAGQPAFPRTVDVREQSRYILLPGNEAHERTG